MMEDYKSVLVSHSQTAIFSFVQGRLHKRKIAVWLRETKSVLQDIFDLEKLKIDS